MKIIQLSTLNKILKDDPLDYKEFNSFSVLKNERFSYQIAFKNDSDKPVTVNVTTLSPSRTRWCAVRYTALSTRWAITPTT